jgi:signal transduction histidine kinase
LVRDEIYRIGREALTNAFRHARADHIKIELQYGSRDFRLLVYDDGCGVDPQMLHAGQDGHRGLSGMRERANRMGAEFRFFSSPSAGTEVYLSVPGRIAYQDRPARGLSWFRYGRRSTGARTRIQNRTT